MNRRMMRSGVVAAFAALAMLPAVAFADSCPQPVSGRHSVHQGSATTRTTHAHGRVATPNGIVLNVRSGPVTAYRVVGTVRDGSVRALVCKTNGSTVQGNERWYKLSHHRGYVSAHYVHAFRAVPWCRYLGN
ncbi:SH3 domain-containing protein [Streptomyces decoyicus]|uniref:SH3 domain-containing protein n=1 Tax=Streptomyces decoyicus TaxID=249567 RepID=UPI003863BE9E|nr:SH3 domain-containing protein [Streptomyces decoyicus]